MRYFALFFLLLSAAPVRAALIDDEVRASEAVQRRLQAALDRRFGPGRASAEAAVRLKLSNRGRGWVSQFFAPGEGTGRFQWGWLGRRAESSGKYVLPGVPQEDEKAEGSAPPVSAAAELLRSFETEIESINVRVALDASLPEEAQAAALALAEEVAGANRTRGDRVTVERVALPTALERALQDPAVLSRLAGHAAQAALGLAGLLAVALIAFAVMRSLVRAAETLSAALRQAAARSIEVRLEGQGALLAGGSGERSQALPAPEDGKTDAEAPESDEIVIEIGVEHVPRLAHLLKDQSPHNVALVMPHLKPEVRSAYLSAVPRESAAEIMLAMTPVRFVEPDLLRQLKEELERRVRGVVGGAEAAAEMLGALGEEERKAVLDRLGAKDPQASARIREKMLLFEDLASLSPDDLAAVAEGLGPEELAAAAVSAENALREDFAAALPGRPGKVFQETMELLRNAPDPGREAQARAKVLAAAEALIRSGKIHRPGGGRAAAALPGPATQHPAVGVAGPSASGLEPGPAAQQGHDRA